MSHTVTHSHTQTTVAKLPGGEDNPPLNDNNHQPAKGPPKVRKNTKKKKGAQAPQMAGTEDTGQGSRANQPEEERLMPGILQTSQMLESTKKTTERVSEAINNLLSPLTPQLTEHDNSKILTNLFSHLRTKSPLIQVYMEGTAPALRIHYGDEIPMDPWMALATINEFLDGIQHQWLNYNQGPERFHNHGINPGQHQAAIIDWIRWAITAQEIKEPTSRASGPITIPPILIKMEGQQSQYFSSTHTKGKEPLRGDQNAPMGAGSSQGRLAPSMPNHPAYLSGWSLDIICHISKTHPLVQVYTVLYRSIQSCRPTARSLTICTSLYRVCIGLYRSVIGNHYLYKSVPALYQLCTELYRFIKVCNR